MPAEIIKVAALGPYSNNAYIVVDTATKHSIFVDAPMEGEKALPSAEGTDVQMVVVTHRHPDHWATLDLIKERVSAAAWCHDEDRAGIKYEVFDTLGDGDDITIGETKIRVIHTPGHTPGSICLYLDTVKGPALLSGDTLFPGGPGRSDSNASLMQMINSITSKLHVLPDNTYVYPGHGDDTNIGDSKKQYAVFATREHDPELRGDVTWEGS
jgi:glyoxylase-like metal-dependent hydrolase (beta-lactamase superfamily II)